MKVDTSHDGHFIVSIFSLYDVPYRNVVEKNTIITKGTHDINNEQEGEH